MTELRANIDQRLTVECPYCQGKGYQFARGTGPHLKAVRLNVGLSQRHVAHVMLIAPSHLSNLEADRRPWTVELVEAFLAAVYAGEEAAKP